MLTDLAIKKAAPKPAGRYEIKDASRPGLRLVVQPSGHKSFVYRYWFGKTYAKVTLGSYPTMTLATAIAEHRKLADALAAGTDPATAFRASRERQASADDTTTAYVETFKVQHVVQLADNTQSYMIAELDRMVDAFGPKAIADVTPADVQKVIDAAITRGPSAQRTSWRVARAFFNWAAPRIGKPSPCEHLRKLSKDDVRERYLDNDEIKTVWEAADAAGVPAGALVKLLLLTGCRRDEICYLRRAEIKAHSIELPGERTKNGHAHSIPITPMIRRVLDSLPASGEFALTGNGAGLGGHSKARAAIETPDLPHWTFHDLRRSFATGLAKLGVPINVTERCLNHISGVGKDFLVQIYNKHDYAPETRAAFETWSAHIESLLATNRAAAAA